MFGHLRTFRETCDTFLKNMVVPCQKAGYDVHIFCHTWDEIDSRQFRDFYPKDMNRAGVKLTNEDIAAISDLYSPVAVLVEPQIEADYPEEIIIRRNQAHTFCGAGKLRQEYARKNGIVYDLVICTRYDIEFLQPFDNIYAFANLLDNWSWFGGDMTGNFFTTYISKCRSVTAYEKLIAGIDLLVFGSIDSIDSINVWEENFEKYINYKSERAITQILCKSQKRHNLIAYEKDKCWRIRRFNDHVRLINKFADKIYKCSLPLLKYSPLFLSHTSFCSTPYKGKLNENLSWFLRRKVL